MFDIGFGEMLLLAAIALIALGPKQLPEVARVAGRFLNQLKRATGDFQRTLSEAGDDVKINLRESVTNPISEAQKAIDQSLAGAVETPPPTLSESQPQVSDEKQMMFDIEKKES